MQLNNDLEKFLKYHIKHWIGKNFGTQEMEDPCYDVNALSEYLAKKLRKEYSKDYVKYELTVLANPEINTLEAIEEIEKHIAEVNKGLVFKREEEGTKRLAYPINGNEHAVYYYLEIGLPETSEAAKLSGWLNIKDTVLRYLMVIKDTRR